jgi:hypothetical protein
VKYIFSLIIILLYACQNTTVMKHSEQAIIDQSNIKANLAFLASDELEGRETATRGERIASKYIANELARYGVKPYGDNGTFFQEFTLYESGYDTENMELSLVNKDGTTIDFEYSKDFAAFANTAIDLDASFDLVFAAYGISAPEFEYDNYKNLDVKGKFVVALMGEPKKSNDSIYFNGEKETTHASTFSKATTAFRNGATGVIILPDEVLKYGFDAMVNYIGGTQLSLNKSAGMMMKFPIVFLNENSMKTFIESNKNDFDKLYNAAKDGSLKEVFTFKNKMNIKLTSMEAREQKARNVVGLIEGTDEKLKKEYVSVGAHYDHLGKRGEVIYNGADDDGSGTVTVMELAKSVALSKKNKRSVLVVFHTGEEKGLFGSKYFTDNFSEIDKVVSNINIDMVGRQSTDSLHVIGSDRLSDELHEIVLDVNSKTTNFKFDFKYNAPNDPNRFYERSDHYNYAKKNIPIAFFFDDMRSDYHKETDTVEKINFDKLEKVTKLVYHITLRISNLDHRLKLK